MSQDRLATALERASTAASRIEAALAALPTSRTPGVEDSAATIKAAIAPILAELDGMIAAAEGETR